jgi:riboflavin kinase / FMN adenylyltransferase
MRILQGLEGLKALPPGGVLSIGNYDGVHRGHARILRMCRELADGRGAPVGAVTFEPHPLTVLRPEVAPQRLTPSPIKERLLREAGADFMVILPPEPAVLDLSAEEFWKLLRDQVRPAHLVEGSEFNFGKGRGGTIHKLREWSAATAVRLEVVEPVEVALADLWKVRVSSSIIRWLLGHGRVRDAAICLGRPYELAGQVVAGHQRGRTLGMPTANLDCAEQLIPADGVYAGRCALGTINWPAAVSIGRMPTFGANRRQVEVHLIGFSGELYGQTIEVRLLDWVRHQQKFPGVDELKRQMQKDLAYTLERQGFDPARAVVAKII